MQKHNHEKKKGHTTKEAKIWGHQKRRDEISQADMTNTDAEKVRERGPVKSRPPLRTVLKAS